MSPIAKRLVRTILLASVAACSSPLGLTPDDGGDLGGGYGFVGSGGGGHRLDGGRAGEDGGIRSTDGGLDRITDGGEVDAGSIANEGGAGTNEQDDGGGAVSQRDGGSPVDGGNGVGVTVNNPAGIFTSLDWSISGPGGLYTGTVFFGDAQSLEFVVGGIQAGNGYTLTLNGIDRYGDECAGTSAPFAVSPGVVTGEDVVIVCPHSSP